MLRKLCNRVITGIQYTMYPHPTFPLKGEGDTGFRRNDEWNLEQPYSET
jgi:hypothetical protein